MTKERAVSLLRRYRQEELSPPEHYSIDIWNMRSFGYDVYARYLSGELIRRIKEAPTDEDPLDTIHHYICWMDEFRKGRDKRNPITERFVGNVVCVVDCIQQYLGEKEEETNETFRSRKRFTKGAHHI